MESKSTLGLDRELNPGPLAPEARIIRLDHQAATNVNKYTASLFERVTIFALTLNTSFHPNCLHVYNGHILLKFLFTHIFLLSSPSPSSALQIQFFNIYFIFRG